MQIIDHEYILICLHLPCKIFSDHYKRSIAINRIVEEILKYESRLQIDKTILVGDFSFPPGTYYYAGNDAISSFWNIYDQVMIRPCLRDDFMDEELKILYKTEKTRLIDRNNRPLKSISDHLPIIFEMREEEK